MWTPSDLNFDLSQQMTKIISIRFFRELSNAAFPFSLRRPGVEIMGAFKHPPPPPPQQAVEKSIGQAGRGLIQITTFDCCSFIGAFGRINAPIASIMLAS